MLSGSAFTTLVKSDVDGKDVDREDVESRERGGHGDSDTKETKRAPVVASASRRLPYILPLQPWLVSDHRLLERPAMSQRQSASQWIPEFGS